MGHDLQEEWVVPPEVKGARAKGKLFLPSHRVREGGQGPDTNHVAVHVEAAEVPD